MLPLDYPKNLVENGIEKNKQQINKNLKNNKIQTIKHSITRSSATRDPKSTHQKCPTSKAVKLLCYAASKVIGEEKVVEFWR